MNPDNCDGILQQNDSVGDVVSGGHFQIFDLLEAYDSRSKDAIASISRTHIWTRCLAW